MMGITSKKSMPAHSAHMLFLYLCEITNDMKMTTTENIRKELQTLADSKYQEFHSSLLGSKQHSRRTHPQLRTMAKEIIKKRRRTFVESTDTIYYERTMLQGMIIGLAKMELEEQMKYVTMFIPRIDNWAVCDIFCSELKTSVKKGKESMAIYPTLSEIL